MKYNNLYDTDMSAFTKASVFLSILKNTKYFTTICLLFAGTFNFADKNDNKYYGHLTHIVI